MKKRLTAGLLAVLAVLSAAPAGAAETNTDPKAEQSAALVLDDVEEGNWYTDAALFVTSYRLLDPLDEQDGHARFAADTALPRETVAETVRRLAALLDPQWPESLDGSEAESLSDFGRVSASHQDAVRFCYGAGIMTGDAQGLFHPDSGISREEFAAVLQRFITLCGEKGHMQNIEQADQLAEGTFADQEQIAGWARPGVAFCRKNSLMNGNRDGTFNPKGRISRAELAQVLYNLMPDSVK